MKVYLHIGYPKTGSTAIQWHVFANRRWFETQGIYIPRTGFWSGLGHAYLLGVGDAAVAEPTRAGLAALAGELETCKREGYRAALLTWEGFVLVGAPALAALGDTLAGYDVEVLAYVRDQASLFQSLVLQGVKNLRDFSQIAAIEQGRPVNGVPRYLDFDAVFSRWEESFPGNMTVRPRLFDRACLHQGDVVADFLHCLSLAPNAEFCSQSDSINQSIGASGALQLINARTAGLHWGGLIQLSRAIQTAYSEHKRDRDDFLDAVGKREVLDQFAAGNARLFTRYRPENVAPRVDGFAPPDSPSEHTESLSTTSYLRDVQQALKTLRVEGWGGGHLQNKNVGQIVVAPGRGWREPEKTGAWSRGPRSEIAFAIPRTHPVAGPTGIRLTLEGLYCEHHTQTRVTIGEQQFLLDLGGAVSLLVPITESVRNDGVRIVLDHQFPQETQGETNLDQAIAYKLRSASYDFVWD